MSRTPVITVWIFRRVLHRQTRFEAFPPREDCQPSSKATPAFGPHGVPRRHREAAKAGDLSFSHFARETTSTRSRNVGKMGSLATKLKPPRPEAGQFTPWKTRGEFRLLFYEGCTAGNDGDIDAGKYVDLGIGVVPVVNLEWIQKIHRDKKERGYSAEATVDTILRRMPDYVKYITPQFSRTHINFQRVATVDTQPVRRARHPRWMKASW
jgi:phosphoribulokinase